MWMEASWPCQTTTLLPGSAQCTKAQPSPDRAWGIFGWNKGHLISDVKLFLLLPTQQISGSQRMSFETFQALYHEYHRGPRGPRCKSFGSDCFTSERKVKPIWFISRETRVRDGSWMSSSGRIYVSSTPRNGPEGGKHTTKIGSSMIFLSTTILGTTFYRITRYLAFDTHSSRAASQNSTRMRRKQSSTLISKYEGETNTHTFKFQKRFLLYFDSDYNYSWEVQRVGWNVRSNTAWGIARITQAT